jgi:hypothetical protein
MGLINGEAAWCYGPVGCELQDDGTVQMDCTAWTAPGVPCPWTHTARNRTTAAIAGLAHSRIH